jgi:hypothetical protein
MTYNFTLAIFVKDTVKPVLTTPSEQRPPVYNGQPDAQFFKIESNL